MTARILRNFRPFFQSALLESIYVGDLHGTSRRAVVSESVSSSKLIFLFIINRRTTIFRELSSNRVLIKIKILLKYNQNLISFQRFNGFNNFNFHSKLLIVFYYLWAHYFGIRWHSIASNFQCCIKNRYWSDNHQSDSGDIKIRVMNDVSHPLCTKGP